MNLSGGSSERTRLTVPVGVAYDTDIMQLAWSPDGSRIAIASGEDSSFAYPFGQLTIFDVASWSLIEPTKLPAGCETNGHHWHVIAPAEGQPTTYETGCVSGYSDEDAAAKQRKEEEAAVAAQRRRAAAKSADAVKDELLGAVQDDDDDEDDLETDALKAENARLKREVEDQDVDCRPGRGTAAPQASAYRGGRKE